jgi:hypothetical protein
VPHRFGFGVRCAAPLWISTAVCRTALHLECGVPHRFGFGVRQRFNMFSLSIIALPQGCGMHPGPPSKAASLPPHSKWSQALGETKTNEKRKRTGMIGSLLGHRARGGGRNARRAARARVTRWRGLSVRRFLGRATAACGLTSDGGRIL